MNRKEDISKESVIERTTAAFSGKGNVLRIASEDIQGNMANDRHVLRRMLLTNAKEPMCLCGKCPIKVTCPNNPPLPDWHGGTLMLEEYPDVLTTEEVCEALRVGYNALYTLLSSGELGAIETEESGEFPKFP